LDHVLAIAKANGYTKEEASEYQRIVAYLIAESEARPASALPQLTVKP
jgi:hypothetical protein